MQIDKNGYLWIYSMNHLQLFDGEEFTDMKSQLSYFDDYGSFSFAKTDDLFFLTNKSLTKLNTSTYTTDNVLTLDIYNTGTIHQSYILSEDSTHLYVYPGSDTLFKIDKADLSIDTRIPFFIFKEDIFPPSDIGEIPKKIESIEFITQSGKLYTFDLKARDTTLLYSQLVSTFATIKPGQLCFQANTQFYLLENGKLDSFPMPGFTSMMNKKFLSIHHGRSILVGMRDYIYEFDLLSKKWTKKFEDIEKRAIYTMGLRYSKIDPLGNIFITDFNRGLLKLSPIGDGFHYFGSGEMQVFVKTVCVSDSLNRVLAGTLHSGLLIYDTLGNIIHQLNPFHGYPELTRIQLIVKISEDRFLLGSDGKAYLLYLTEETAKATKIYFPSSKGIDYFSHQIPTDNPDYIYFTTGYAIGRMERKKGADKVEFIYTYPHSETTSSIQYKDGYILTKDRELVYFNSDFTRQTSSIRVNDLGLIRCITRYDEEHALIGGSFGLFIINLESGIIKKKIFDKLIYAILPGNADGEFWFTTDFGLFKLDPGFYFTNFTKESGLQDNEFNTNACYRTPNGKLYFAGVNGVTSFYPENIQKEFSGITSIVKYISAGERILGRFLNFEKPRTFNLEYNENTINIGLLGLGSKSPSNYNYQYFVKGVNEGWIDMGRNKTITLQLPPGDYKFYYEVNNVFNKNAALQYYFILKIKPPFYRSFWFIFSLALTAATIIVYFYRQQIAKKKLQMHFDDRLKERMHSDRMRISRELHDNIGAQMATVKRSLNFLGTHLEVLSKDKVEAKLQDIENISSQLNQELRDTIWATQNVSISIGDFIGRIKNFVFQHFPPEGNVRVSYEEKCDKQVILSPFVALNLQRICQEALNNILKHAKANEVMIRFAGDTNKFSIRIEDDGKGFHPDQTIAGYGLENMQHRSVQIGAKLSYPDTAVGTHISIELDTVQPETQL